MFFCREKDDDIDMILSCEFRVYIFLGKAQLSDIDDPMASFCASSRCVLIGH
jgi:hypothetical protein